jgi:hypothetical protein
VSSRPISSWTECTYCYQGSYKHTCADQTGFRWPDEADGHSTTCAGYCHLCGVAAAGSRDLLYTKKLYLKTTTTPQSAYNPLCPNVLCSINYTQSNISININGQSLCLSSNLSNSTSPCPNINISSTMNQLSVTNNNVSSSCDQCLASTLKASLADQSLSFVTKREKRRCILGVITSCSINPNGLVSGGWQSYYNHASWLLQCGGGAPQYGCGKLGGPITETSDLTMGVTWECLEGLACGIPANIVGLEIQELQWRYSQQLKSRFDYLGKGTLDVPVSDIVEGVVPGSVSTVKQLSYNGGGMAITRAGDISENVSTVHVFYYEYDYIRPVNIQDLLRNNNSILCTPENLEITNTNSNGICSFVPFPPAYAANLQLYWAYRFNVNKGNLDGVSYAHLKPYYRQNSGCEGAVSCYYKHRVFICGTSDFCCLADLNVTRNVGVDGLVSGEPLPTCGAEDGSFPENPQV